MNSGKNIRAMIAIAICCLAIGTVRLAAASKPVLVHYMPWFVAKPYSGSWGWHWTMNHFNPDLIDAAGTRQIASWYYPLIGPYDSADSVVLEYHVMLMKLAGIDGVIVDWYGMDNYADYASLNQRTAALLNLIQRAGLKFSLCYEDRTIQQEISGGYLSSTSAIAHAQQTMLYAQTNYFNDPSYFRRSGLPLLLNFGPQYFKTNGQWTTIFSVLAASNQPSFFTEDNRVTGAAGAFDWPPMYLSQSSGGVLTISALNNYLTSFEQSGKFWPAYVSSAFPRYHDIYAQAGVGNSNGTLDDNSGDTFQSTLRRAFTNNSAIVQIVTWNDFGEGTIVEPTREFGYRDLGIIQDLRRQYLDPAYSGQTNDLTLATRLYNLRRQYPTNIAMMAELDRVFTNIVNGNLSGARLQLTGAESNQPAIYDLASSNGFFQFSIGGYVASSGAQVQTTSNLSMPLWGTVFTFPVGTNLMRFSTPIHTEGAPTFFRVQTTP
jgi:hypothetical protein